MKYRSIIRLAVVNSALLLVVFACSAMASDSEEVSVLDFLTSDGLFDLEVARDAGIEGPLDLEGHTFTFDPVTGAPGIGEKVINLFTTINTGTKWQLRETE